MHQISLSFLLFLLFPLCPSVFLSVCLTRHSLYPSPHVLFSLSHCFCKCSSSPWWNQLRHSWITLICGWFKCLIIFPPRSGPHQSLYSQSNLITLTTKTVKSYCPIHLASPDNTAFHWCKRPIWGLVQILIWIPKPCIRHPKVPLMWNGWSTLPWMDKTWNVYSVTENFDILFIVITRLNSFMHCIQKKP